MTSVNYPCSEYKAKSDNLYECVCGWSKEAHDAFDLGPELPKEPAPQQPLPCPFCGKKPYIQFAKKQYCQLHGDPYQDVILRCCVVTIQKACREFCIETWNKRQEKLDADTD